MTHAAGDIDHLNHFLEEAGPDPQDSSLTLTADAFTVIHQADLHQMLRNSEADAFKPRKWDLLRVAARSVISSVLHSESVQPNQSRPTIHPTTLPTVETASPTTLELPNASKSITIVAAGNTASEWLAPVLSEPLAEEKTSAKPTTAQKLGQRALAGLQRSYGRLVSGVQEVWQQTRELLPERRHTLKIAAGALALAGTYALTRKK